MEWPDPLQSPLWSFSLSPSSFPSGVLSRSSEQPPVWSPFDNLLFGDALAELNLDSTDKSEKIALETGKTPEQIENHNEAPVEDVMRIEPGSFPIADNVATDTVLGKKYGDTEMLPEKGGRKKPSSRQESSSSTEATSSRSKPKKAVPWNDEEHRLFLMGLNKYGKGDWKSISRDYVVTKTSSQVASHAQKYFVRINNSSVKEKRRPSINDTRSVNGKLKPMLSANINFKPIAPAPFPTFRPSPMASFPLGGSTTYPISTVPSQATMPNRQGLTSFPLSHGQPPIYGQVGGNMNYPSNELNRSFPSNTLVASMPYNSNPSYPLQATDVQGRGETVMDFGMRSLG